MASWIVHYDFHPQRYHQAQVSNHKLQYTRFSQFHILLKIYDEFHEIQSKPEDVRDNMVVWQSCSSSLSSSLLTLGNPQPLIASISLTCWWQFCEDRVWSFSTTDAALWMDLRGSWFASSTAYLKLVNMHSNKMWCCSLTWGDNKSYLPYPAKKGAWLSTVWCFVSWLKFSRTLDSDCYPQRHLQTHIFNQKLQQIYHYPKF